MLIRTTTRHVGSWHVSATLPRPSGLSRSLWHQALLGINETLMREACIAFGLDEQDEVVLCMQPDAPFGDPLAMARELQRFHEIWCGAHGVASAASAAPIALSAIEDFVVPADTCEDDEVEQQEEAASQCLMDNLLGLGVSAQRACQIAAAGHLWLDNAEIAFEPACRGKALLLHISLQNGPLDGTGEAALWLNNKLMAEHGLAMGRGEHGYRLLAHWPCDGRAGLAFKDYLLTLADLPTTLIGDTASRGQADNELDALLRI